MQRLAECFLDQVFGFGRVLREPARKVIERIEQRHGQPLEFFVIGSLGCQFLIPVNSRTRDFIPAILKHFFVPLRTFAGMNVPAAS
jgi:hypothetical protein